MALFKLTKQDRDYYALQDLIKPKEEQQEERAGIGTKPSKQEQDEEGLFSSFFGGLFDRSKERSAEIAKEMQEQQSLSQEKEISDYLRRTTVSDALYDTLKLPNPAYGGLKLVEDRPMTEAELEQYAPLIDLANEIREETITVKELGAMNKMDQEAFLKSLSGLKVNERSSSFEGDTFEVASSREEFLRDLMKKREADKAKPKDDEVSRLKEFLLREETDSTSDGIEPVDTTPIDADGGAASSGKGLMSPRLDSKGEGPEKKQVIRPKLRPEGLDSLEEKERIKAVQTVIGTKADGAFGRNSKAKLKAWQYVHNVPVTGEIDEVTLSSMKNPDTYDPREIARDDFMLSKTFDLLKGVEGFEENAYLGAISDKFKSGLTVGAGIDFGQHTKDSLLSKGLPKSLVEKADAAGWIGLNPDTVIDPQTGQPASQGRGNKAQRRARGKALLEAKVAEQKEDGTFPDFTYEELAESTPIMYSDYEKAAKESYEREYGEGSWSELKEGVKAVLSTEKYHRGTDYTLPESMLAGARTNNALEAARGIATRSRRNNMTAWLRKVGLS